MTRAKEEPESKWARASEAMKHFHVCRNTLNKIALECDARKTFGEKVVIYDITKIEKYIEL